MNEMATLGNDNEPHLERVSSTPLVAWHNNKRFNKTNKCIYDYTQLEIDPKKQMSKSMATNGYVRILFLPDAKQTTPQLFFSKSQTQVQRYFVSTLYIFTKPEPKIVIENTPFTSGAPIWVHIPIQFSKKGRSSGFADLLNGNQTPVKISINGLLGSTAAAYFEHQSILLTRDPLVINLSADSFPNATTPPNVVGLTIQPTRFYSIIQMQVLGNSTFPVEDYKEGFQEGLDEPADEEDPLDSVNYECVPIDIGYEDTPFMSVPINSNVIDSSIHINLMQNLVHLFYLGLMIAVCVFVVSHLYTAMIHALDSLNF